MQFLWTEDSNCRIIHKKRCYFLTMLSSSISVRRSITKDTSKVMENMDNGKKFITLQTLAFVIHVSHFVRILSVSSFRPIRHEEDQ